MKRFFVLLFLTSISGAGWSQSKALVFQSDFGLKDGAVSAMKGVAYSLSPELAMFDLTHEIPAYNIWEGAYRLYQTASYWPAGTVFVSVVDPGVGSVRRSVVMKSKSGHYFVTPDNGTLTLVAQQLGIEEVRIIDETRNRLKNSDASYTFHGRDVYAFTGAKLAAGIITFAQVGDSVIEDVVRLRYQHAVIENKTLKGTIDILDVQYGNLWTNIGKELLDQFELKDGNTIQFKISRNGKQVYAGEAVFGKTFADVPRGKSIAYRNSLLNFALAINQGNFASLYKIGSGSEWSIEVVKK